MTKELKNQQFLISQDLNKDFFYRFYWAGRYETIEKNPLTIVDVAHNIDGIKALTESIQKDSRMNAEIHCVFATLDDKPNAERTDLLKPFTNQFKFAPLAQPRATKAFEQSSYRANNFKLFDTACLAYKQASIDAKPKNAKVLICGSIFLIAEILSQKRSTGDYKIVNG